jgi:PAS domain S-box-containing protein
MTISNNLSYKRFFDLSMDMFCIANKEGYFVQVNEAFSQVLGYTRDQLLAQPFMNLVHPNDIEGTLKELDKLNQGTTVLNFSNRYQHINGHYLTLSWSSQTCPDNGLIYAIARNITEQLNQTNRLEQLERTLNKESIITVTDKRGIITEVNDRFCDISGYTREELIGRTHNIVSSHSHSKEFFKDLWRTVSSKNIWSDVIKNKNKCGEYYYVNTIITPLVDHEDNIVAYLSIRQDISSSIQHQSDLSKTLSILNETRSIAKIGGWELNAVSSALTWTNETFRILEVEQKNELQPLLPLGLSLFTPKYQSIIENAVNRALEFGESYSLELEAKTAKGKLLWIYTNGKANYENGKIVSLSGTIQDIDTRKRAQISYDLERQKSIQSAKISSLGELAASMAHEINNPLGIISGYSELMLQTDDINKNMSSKLEVVLKSCSRIAHMVSNLKRFSRTEEKHEYVKRPLAAIVHEAISLAQPRLKRELVEVQFIKDKSITLKCNEIEIEQVVLNLINNSIDAVKKLPNKWIKLSLQIVEGFIELRIVDSGKGIPQNVQKKIFTPFFTTKKPGEGTGLGLSIIASILSDHGALITYDHESENTSFLITFLMNKRSNYDH